MDSGYIKKEVMNPAQTVQDMDKKARTRSTIFNRLNPANCEQLKPISVYSRTITCDQKATLHPFCNPFINLKIEVMNTCGEKRTLDDSTLDECYETPAKKAFSSQALSPDLGCFIDHYCSTAKLDSVSPFAVSESALLNNTQAVRGEMKQTVSSQLHSEHVECGSSTEPGDNKGTVPHSLKYEKKVLLNVAPAFDCDVEDILCLNPFSSYAAGGFSDNVESCRSPSSHTFQNKPVLIPPVEHGQELERGDLQVEGEREEMKKEMHLNVKDVEEDQGYFSMSYIKDLKTGKDLSQLVYPQLPPATSRPLLRIGEAPETECHPESSSEPSCHQQAVLSGHHVSFTVNDLHPVVSGPLLESVNSPMEPLEGDVEEAWEIGLPIFESSLCHNVTVKLNAGSEQSRQVSEEVQGGIMEPIQATLGGEETTPDTSYETTLPLQVQVKSVVVAPSQHPSSSKPAASPLPKQNAKPTKLSPKDNRVSQTAKCVNSARSQRPVIFDRELDLERDKRIYLHSVTRHMNENPGSDHDVMSELLDLMTHVADQTPGTNGRQWQHPSDLTRRNYQRRFGNMIPTISLHEWQAKNCTTHKRFAEVPKIFQRTQFP